MAGGRVLILDDDISVAKFVAIVARRADLEAEVTTDADAFFSVLGYLCAGLCSARSDYARA